jgi:putative ABC transport system ATP-binding protein
MELIRLEGIGKHYGGKQVLNKIDFHVDEGQFIAILGDSGTGKSTLLNIIGLLEVPDFGEYSLVGKSLKVMNSSMLTQYRSSLFGFVFQLFYLIPNLSVYDNIMVPFIYAHKTISNIDNWILMLAESLGIKSLLGEKVDYLSGGEKQRVALARALVNEPKVLICDEPTGNLDCRNADVVMSLLRQETQKNRAVILVTHDERIAKKADIVYTLSHTGELIRNE